MIEKIKLAIERIEKLSKKKTIKIISHFDTDGITSAAIFSRALERWKKQFSLTIVKSLDEEFIKNLQEDNILIFLDLASGNLNQLNSKKSDIFIFDHHEIIQEIPNNVFMVNPLLHNSEIVSTSAICYLFARQLSYENKDLANLAVIGLIGDSYGENINKIFSEIINDSEIIVKKGLLLYPSTRPLDKTLEYSFIPYIPKVSGYREEVIELLRDANIETIGGKYKALYELNGEEMTKLVTAIILRSKGNLNNDNIIGNLFLVKFFNKLEDARELSALINACSRMGYPEIALSFCLGNKFYKAQAEKIYIGYKQSLLSALRNASETERIEGKDYIIINSKDKIKDTMIGTVASIISHSPVYQEGVIIIALAYNDDKIKVSARIVGKKGRNVRDVLNKAIIPIGGEVGGHPNAAGCIISKEKEQDFIFELKKVLDVETIKV